ncbi:MAG: chitinase [Planctomycetota bacterium]
MQALQAQGKKVLISIGGATGPVHLDSSADVAAFVASMHGIITTWGFDGLDIDLEGSSLSVVAGDTDFANPTSPRIVNFIAAVTQLVAMLPADFLLTAAPETATLQGAYSAYGGVWGAYLAVIHALRNDLDWVQVQHYNTGSMFGRDGQIYSPGTAAFHVAMADMLTSGFYVPAAGSNFPPLAPEQVVIGLPASPGAAGSGFTTAPLVHDALDQLYLGLPTTGYLLGDPDGFPRLRGVMTWSINWDVDSSLAFSAAHRKYLDEVNLAVDVPQISSAAGGAIGFTLRAGLPHAGRGYFLVPTLSGTSPGTWLSGNRIFPINLDAASLWPFQAGTAGYFSGIAGNLDASGSGTASIAVPPTVAATVTTAHFAFVLDHPWEFFSDPVAVEFLP